MTMKMKKLLTLGLVLTWLSSPFAHAMAMTDAGNTTCPVSGDKISGKDFVEHHGKKYGLCCAMCADKMMKHPEKYLAETSKPAEAHHDHHDHSM
jgi:YHS domain-containing protein